MQLKVNNTTIDTSPEAKTTPTVTAEASITIVNKGHN